MFLSVVSTFSLPCYSEAPAGLIKGEPEIQTFYWVPVNVDYTAQWDMRRLLCHVQSCFPQIIKMHHKINCKSFLRCRFQQNLPSFSSDCIQLMFAGSCTRNTTLSATRIQVFQQIVRKWKLYTKRRKWCRPKGNKKVPLAYLQEVVLYSFLHLVHTWTLCVACWLRHEL